MPETVARVAKDLTALMTDDFAHQQINLISHLLALVFGFLPNGRTIASTERNGIYPPERPDKDHQFDKIAHPIESFIQNDKDTVSPRELGGSSRSSYAPAGAVESFL